MGAIRSAVWLLRCDVRPRNSTSGRYLSRRPLYSSGLERDTPARSKASVASWMSTSPGKSPPLGCSANSARPMSPRSSPRARPPSATRTASTRASAVGRSATADTVGVTPAGPQPSAVPGNTAALQKGMGDDEAVPDVMLAPDGSPYVHLMVVVQAATGVWYGNQCGGYATPTR